MASTAPIDPDLLPTEADVAFYREHGWYVSPPVLPPQLLDDAAEGCRRFYAGERDVRLPEVAGAMDWTPAKGEVLRTNAYVSLQIREVARLVRAPILGAIAARLARTRVVRLFRDQLLYKPPARHGRNTRVGWHSDRAYWQTCTSRELLTAWVPLEGCDEHRGTLLVLDGSHRWPEHAALTFGEQDLEGRRARLDTGGAPAVEVPLVLAKGQVSFHHCRTLHASRDNLSETPRVSLAIHLQDAGNRYRVHRNAEGRPVAHLNDLLCRRLPSGEPDYTDPDICPVLWSEGEPAADGAS